jgi:hypothetical protein
VVVAEAPTFDTGAIVLLLLVAFLLLAAALAVAVAGFVAGLRLRADRGDERARRVWQGCVLVEVLAAVVPLAAGNWQLAAVAAGVLLLTLAARGPLVRH